MELWEKDNRLIPQNEWEDTIDQLKAKTGEEITNKQESITHIKTTFTNAIKQRIPQNKFGIFLSGGVDSTLIATIAKQFTDNFICYAIGFHAEGMQQPQDIINAKKAAKQLNLNLKTKILTLGEVEQYAKELAPTLKKNNALNVVNLPVSIVIAAAANQAKEDNITTFLAGLGAEEIFAGYNRHKKVDDIQAECWRGMKEMWSKDLIRDATLTRHLNITVKTPFLDKDLITTAMAIPAEFKINSQEKKVILRETAEQMGVPKEIAWRKKQAAQYGSYVDKAIEKCAKKYNFSTKGDYVESLAKDI
jgi:diphthine-ammonia ligase